MATKLRELASSGDAQDAGSARVAMLMAGIAPPSQEPKPKPPADKPAGDF